MKVKEVTMSDGTVYRVRESVSAAVGLQWIREYFPEPDDDEAKSADAVERVKTFSFKSMINKMDDYEFLACNTVVDEKNKPYDCDEIPLHHSIELLESMREALHIAEFIDAITAGIKKNSVVADDDNDTDKKK